MSHITYSCLSVDDDPLALKIVATFVEKTPFLQLKASFDNAIEALDFFRDNQVDLLFLDVEMPDMTGIELIETLKNPPKIILTTSMEKYAITAFDHDVADYLLKPIKYPRFLKAVEKAIGQMGTETTKQPTTLFVKEDNLLVGIPFEHIIWVEAFGDYVKIHTQEKMFTIYTTLRQVESKLPPTDFVRVHRSFIVRLDQIKNIDVGNLQVAERIIPISNTYRAGLLSRIQTL